MMERRACVRQRAPVGARGRSRRAIVFDISMVQGMACTRRVVAYHHNAKHYNRQNEETQSFTDCSGHDEIERSADIIVFMIAEVIWRVEQFAPAT